MGPDTQQSAAGGLFGRQPSVTTSAPFFLFGYVIDTVSSCSLAPGLPPSVSAVPLTLWVPLPLTIFKDQLCKLPRALTGIPYQQLSGARECLLNEYMFIDNCLSHLPENFTITLTTSSQCLCVMQLPHADPPGLCHCPQESTSLSTDRDKRLPEPHGELTSVNPLQQEALDDIPVDTICSQNLAAHGQDVPIHLQWFLGPNS